MPWGSFYIFRFSAILSGFIQFSVSIIDFHDPSHGSEPEAKFVRYVSSTGIRITTLEAFYGYVDRNQTPGVRTYMTQN